MGYQMVEIPPRMGGPVLKALARRLPLPDAHRHLRRIKAVDTADGDKRLHVLLAPEGADVTAAVDELANIHDLSPETRVVEVPECEPRTRDELERVRALWPVHFRPPVPPPPIDDESSAGRIRPWVARLLEHAHAAAGLAAPTTDVPAFHPAFADPIGPNAALLVDPKRQVLVCKASAPARAPALGWGPHLNPLRHAVMEVAAGLGRCLTSSHKRSRAGQTREAAVSEPAFCPEEDQYLATGMHLLVVREPCPMCSMALVHSRVARVLYLVPSPCGGLGSACSIHDLPGLNHHFRVARVANAESLPAPGQEGRGERGSGEGEPNREASVGAATSAVEPHPASEPVQAVGGEATE